jgi:crotonobetainyl-CoA:carnitine CoA-transferase CaiB-like acyl-CoA transferase
MISVTGEEGGRGVRAGTSIADMTAGMYAAFGIMLALRVKERTGRGQSIDVSMLEGQMSLLGTMIGGFLADGELPAPMGTAYKALLPYQTFRTKTRDLALAVGSEKLWQIFCPAIGRPELANDPRYRRNADRAKNRATLIPLLQEVFLTKTYEEWEAIFLPQGIPFGAINNIAQVVAHPQVKVRGRRHEDAAHRARGLRPARHARRPTDLREPGRGSRDPQEAEPAQAHGVGGPALPFLGTAPSMSLAQLLLACSTPSGTSTSSSRRRGWVGSRSEWRRPTTGTSGTATEPRSCST